MSTIPTLETASKGNVYLIGGEKGGVGKSFVARLLAQHFIDQQIPFLGFDTDRSHGTLSRFYTGFASPVVVDRYEALDAIIESAVELPARRVLVDLAAQTLEPLTRWMEESGVLDLADMSGVALHYWHVMDNGRDSLELLHKLLERFGARLHYVLVRNHVRGDDFGLLEKSGLQDRALALGARVINLKRLHDGVVQKIDAANSSFWAASNNNAPDGLSLGLLERQRLRIWLAHARHELKAAGV
ncbi:mobilization protein [Aquincola sp. S2]|uniref:Mobilization protein n=1 Tax=Pseudaquabacterium terrae TaxID=2732868 RepID=A0ABX2EKA5_9BURK|nr:mobilization protein [Aquabacterium terrae]NRF69038.1 mobilization protein [Aquabacterium terrae]